MNTTIVTVDDDRNFREFLQSLLRQDGGITLVGQADNGEEALRRTRELHPDIVLMDITMPRVNGFDATRSIKSYRPQTKVIILTVHSDYTYEQAALDNGADAFIAKKRLSTDLPPTIHGLMTESAAEMGSSDAIIVIDTDNGLRERTATYLRARMNGVIKDCSNTEAHALTLPDGVALRVAVVDAEHTDSEFLSSLRGRFPGLGIIVLIPSDSGQTMKFHWVAGGDVCVARNRIDIELIPAITALISRQPKLARVLDIMGER